MAAAGNLSRAAAARQALAALRNDDSHRVSASAIDAWQRTAVRLAMTTTNLGHASPGQQRTTEVPVQGGPLAGASCLDSSDATVHAHLEDSTLQISWRPDRSGPLDATVTLHGAAGDAYLHVHGVARAEPRTTEPGTTPHGPSHEPVASHIDRDLEQTFRAGHAAAARGGWDTAIACFEQVVAVAPTYPHAQAWLDHARHASRGQPSKHRTGRRLLNSLWILGPLLSFGLLTWASFLYIGARVRHGPWLITAACYGAAATTAFAIIGTSPRAANRPIDTVAAFLLLATWIGGFIHAVAVNHAFLQRLERTRTQ